MPEVQEQVAMMMKSLLTAAAILGLISSAAVAQSTALADPNAPLPLIAPVYDNCVIVSGEPDRADVANGICISSTRTYVGDLKGRDPAVIDQAIADLVLQIAPLAQNDQACNAFDDEVAEAIRYASGFVSTPEQIQQLVEIAQTISDCAQGQTAEIVPKLVSG